MLLSASKTRWLLFGVLTALILLSNTLVYRLEMAQPVPSGMALGSLLDLVVVIPLLAYVLLIRKRYSLKPLLLVILAGAAAAYFIIPQQHLAPYAFLKYVIFAGEGAFLLFELYLGYLLLRKIPAVSKQLRAGHEAIQAFPHRLQQAATTHFKQSRLVDVYCTEASVFYYSLFSWRKRPTSGFTYHTKTSAIAFYVMLIHALLIESVGFHFLLHSWNPIVSTILLILNVYTLLLFTAEIQAIRLAPFMITDEYLYLQVGVMKRLKVAFADIESVHTYEGPEKLSREEEKLVFNAVLADFAKEKPALKITFKTPQTAQLMYGFTKQVNKAHIRPDDVQGFVTLLNAKIGK